MGAEAVFGGKLSVGVYLIGQVIKRTRESVGMTQEELSSGICTVETLSRFENGKHIPSRTNFEALMGRMGKCGEKYLPFIHHHDMQVHFLFEKWNQLMIQNQDVEAELVWNELETMLDLKDPVNRQLAIRAHALLDYRMGRVEIWKFRELLIQALACTVSTYQNDGKLPKGFFMNMEMQIFVNIASSYYLEGEFEIATTMLEEIHEYYNYTSVDMEERYRIETLILNLLARCYAEREEREKAEKISIQNVNNCILMEMSINLPSAIYGIAFQKMKLSKNRNECITLLLQAYYVAELQKNSYMMEHIQKHVLDNYGEDIWLLFG